MKIQGPFVAKSSRPTQMVASKEARTARQASSDLADRTCCLEMPEQFGALAHFYQGFDPMSEEEAEQEPRPPRLEI